MTLIELYDRTPVENITASLALHPDRVIFVTSEARRTNRAIPLYRQIFEGRGMQIEMQVKSAAKNDIGSVADVIYDIIHETDDDQIVVDFSGGDESALVSVGMILGSCSVYDKKLCAFRLNITSRRGVLFEMRQDGGSRVHIDRNIYDFSANSGVYLTVAENIILHGGRILSKGINFRKGDPVSDDVRVMWSICRRDCTSWNAKIGRLSGAVSEYNGSRKLFVLPTMSFGDGRNDVDRGMWNEFVKTGLVDVDEKKSTADVIVFRYKNKIVEECLNKSGSALEYYTYLCGLEAENNGDAVYDDAQLSVVIDWDTENGGTTNEIDCIFMNGVVPVFVSCKNGDVKSDELYKLDAVSDKFGSGYAKSALVSTVYFDRDAKAYDGDRAVQTLKDRADDMHIRLLAKVHEMTEGRLCGDLAKIVS